MASSQKQPPLPVTDHAVVRYLERILGVDVAAVRAHLQPGRRARDTIYEGRLGRELRIKKRDCTLVVVDGHIVTVLEKR